MRKTMLGFLALAAVAGVIGVLYFHTDRETPETVPWTGLQATTRAYAKVVDEVNKHPLSTFQRPDEPVPSPR